MKVFIETKPYSTGRTGILKKGIKKLSKILVFPLNMIAVCFIALAVILILSKRRSNNTGRVREEEIKLALKKTAQDFVNVKDIKDIFLYNMDGYAISYIKVQPIALDLLSKTEKKLLTKKLTDEFSETEEDFKFLAVSRPVDITPLVIEYSELLRNSHDPIQKEVLRNEISVISEFSLSGEVVQREFYYMLWEREKENAESDLRKRAGEFSEKLNLCGLKSEIMKKPDIVRLCNLINNPAFAAIEDTNVDAVIPYLE